MTISQAMSDLNAIAIDLEKKYPQSNAGRRVRMRPLFETTVGDYRASLNLLVAAVVCVLLIACANVANLQFARAFARAREIAVRVSLGTGRWVITRQLLVESPLLAVIGAVAGVLLTVWCMDAILALTPPNVPRFHQARIDLHVLAFTTFAAMLAGVLVGVSPAWRISHSESISLALHEAGGRSGSEGGSRQRMRSGLVIMQVALAIVLLAGAGLTLKSFWHAQNAPLGFDPHGVANFEVSLPLAKYKTDEQRDAFWTQLLQRVQSIPVVEAAAVSVQQSVCDTNVTMASMSPALRRSRPTKGRRPKLVSSRPITSASCKCRFFAVADLGRRICPVKRGTRARSSSTSPSRRNILRESYHRAAHRR